MSLDIEIAQLQAIIDSLQEAVANLKRIDNVVQGSGPTVEELPFSVRAAHCLRNESEYQKLPQPLRLAHVASWSRADFLRIPNFGWISYLEVWQQCVKHGYWRQDDSRYLPPEKYMARLQRVAAELARGIPE